jgi:O-antigen/teichoic acid export membrane protein
MASLSIAAFGLRGASAAAKLLLVVYLASAGSSELLGKFAVISTVVAIFIQVAGLEINQVVGRRIHKLKVEEVAQILREQILLCALTYIALIPICLLVNTDLLLPYWFLVAIILVLEHFITEIYRLNILFLRPVFASCLLFIKNAGWVAIYIGFTWFNLEHLNFLTLLYCWSGILFLTALPLIVIAWNHHSHNKSIHFLATFNNALELVKEAIPFVISALLAAGIAAVDKLALSKLFPISELGIFFFYSTCASILSLIVTFTVGSTSGPKCIKIYSTKNLESFLSSLQNLKKQYWAVIIVTMSLLLLLAKPLIGYLDKESYLKHFDLFIFLLVGAAFISLCDPYKLNEYLSRRDRSLVIGNAFHFLTLVFFVLIGVQTREIYFVAVGVMFSSILTFIFFFLGLPKRVAYLVKLQP